MDILKAPPPRPPSRNSIAYLTGSESEIIGSDMDGGASGESILGSGDIIKPLSNSIKGWYNFFYCILYFIKFKMNRRWRKYCATDFNIKQIKSLL